MSKSETPAETGRSLRILPGGYAIHRNVTDIEGIASGTSSRAVGAGESGSMSSASSPTRTLLCRLTTPDGTTLVCPSDLAVRSEGVESGWRCLEVIGPLDFGLTGVLAGLTGILADAEIPVFVLSSFETDYILIRESRLETAVQALEKGGCHIAR